MEVFLYDRAHLLVTSRDWFRPQIFIFFKSLIASLIYRQAKICQNIQLSRMFSFTPLKNVRYGFEKTSWALGMMWSSVPQANWQVFLLVFMFFEQCFFTGNFDFLEIEKKCANTLLLEHSVTICFEFGSLSFHKFLAECLEGRSTFWTLFLSWIVLAVQISFSKELGHFFAKS